MNTSLLLAYPEFMAQVFRLSSEKRTGTIFITSDDSHLVRMVLNEGKITYLVFDTKFRGYDAIPLIQAIKMGRLQFAEGVFETAQEVPLPSTEDIFQIFYENYTNEETTQATQTPPNLKDIIEHIKKALANYIGPIAMIVCDEHIERVGSLKTVGDIFIMLEAVAPEIEELKEQEIFKKQVKEDMASIGLT